MSCNYHKDYDFAYTQAHNLMGLRDAGQLHNVARAFAALRERGHEVAASFIAFWDAWDSSRIVPRNFEAMEWEVLDKPDEVSA
jgi:lysyl-tRNA synthetase class I